jgi:hypothetical protein
MVKGGVVNNKGIFVSYRRSETTAYAGWLADRLGNYFGKQNVFRDIGSIELGMDFVEAIERALGGCAVMLVVIGRNWATALKEYGQTGQEDYARLEVSTALERNVRVIPVLVQGAFIPHAEELPNDLAPLRRRQAIELHDLNWDSDVEHLIGELERIVGKGEERTTSSKGSEQRTPRHVAPGTIFVRRTDAGTPHGKEPINRRTIKLSIDGKQYSDLANDQHTEAKLSTGSHTLEVRFVPYDRDPGVPRIWRNSRLYKNLFGLDGMDEAGREAEAHITVHVDSGGWHEVLCGSKGGMPFIKQQ